MDSVSPVCHASIHKSRFFRTWLCPANSRVPVPIDYLLLAIALSQAPRHYEAEPIENLTQFFPYPEKDDGGSPNPQPTTPTPDEEGPATQVVGLPEPEDTSTLATTAVATVTPATTTTATTVAPATTITTTTTELEMPVGLDLSCFDVNLDLLSTEDAALLAEQMLKMMLDVQDDPVQAASIFTSATQSQQPPPEQPEQPEPSQLLQVKQERDELYPPTQPALSTQPTAPTQSTQTRSSLTKFNPEYATSFPQSYSESFFADIPTQEQASSEAKIVLCGTYLSPQKKVRSSWSLRSVLTSITL